MRLDGPIRLSPAARLVASDDGAVPALSRQAVLPAVHCSEGEAAHSQFGGVTACEVSRHSSLVQADQQDHAVHRQYVHGDERFLQRTTHFHKHG